MRIASETPIEYQKRLSRQLASKEQAEPGKATTEMLSTLTQAYMPERYGGISADEETRSQLRTWVPDLIIRRLTGKTMRSTRIKRK